MKSALLALWLAMVSLGGVVAQETLPGVYSDPETGITFPPALGGLEYRGMRRYEQPGLGYSLRYQNNLQLKADVYVYDAGQILVVDGCDNPPVRREAESVYKQIQGIVKQGVYRDLKMLESGIEPANGTFRFAWNRYEFFTVDKNPELNALRLSECFVTVCHGKFIKIRLTYLKSEEEDGRRAARDFAQALAVLLESASTPPTKTGS